MTITTVLEVWPSDAPRPMAWDEAVKWCASLGEGWRLPTREELDLMYRHKDELGGFGEGWFWSSSQIYINYVYYAWGQRFSDGYQGYFSVKSLDCAVRAVRA